MLKNFFSSQTRVKLLNLFLRNPDRSYYVRELTRKLKERINSIRRELENLTEIGLLKDEWIEKKRYYRVNQDFFLYQELRALVFKANSTPPERLAEMLSQVGQVGYALLSGIFTQSNSKIDLLIAGSINREKLNEVVKKLEREQAREINFTVMTENEFRYRRELDDRFLKEIFDSPHVVVLDRDKEPKSTEKSASEKIFTGRS